MTKILPRSISNVLPNHWNGDAVATAIYNFCIWHKTHVFKNENYVQCACDARHRECVLPSQHIACNARHQCSWTSALGITTTRLENCKRNKFIYIYIYKQLQWGNSSGQIDHMVGRWTRPRNRTSTLIWKLFETINKYLSADEFFYGSFLLSLLLALRQLRKLNNVFFTKMHAAETCCHTKNKSVRWNAAKSWTTEKNSHEK